MARRVDPERIPEELELVRDLIANGELDEANQILSGVLLLGPEGEDEVEAHYLRGELLMARGEPRLALLAYQSAATAAPADSDVLSSVGEALFALWEFEKARSALEKALRADPRNPAAHRFLALTLDRLEKRKLAAPHFRRAYRLDPEAYPLPVRVERETFDRFAREAIESLPDEVKARLGPIGFLVEDYPTLPMLADRPDDADPETLGVFFGEELPARYESSGLNFVPNHIHLFQRNLEHAVADLEELEDEIRTTVYHEVGHYLGYDEDDLDALGLG